MTLILRKVCILDAARRGGGKVDGMDRPCNNSVDDALRLRISRRSPSSSLSRTSTVARSMRFMSRNWAFSCALACSAPRSNWV
jgi:hypothetical protein